MVAVNCNGKRDSSQESGGMHFVGRGGVRGLYDACCVLWEWLQVSE